MFLTINIMWEKLLGFFRRGKNNNAQNIIIGYSFKEDTITIKSEIKKGEIIDILKNWLNAQIGYGADEGEPQERDIYNISICIKNDKIIYFSENTGNKSLAIGILLETLTELEKEKNKITIIL